MSRGQGDGDPRRRGPATAHTAEAIAASPAVAAMAASQEEKCGGGGGGRRGSGRSCSEQEGGEEQVANEGSKSRAEFDSVGGEEKKTDWLNLPLAGAAADRPGRRTRRRRRARRPCRPPRREGVVPLPWPLLLDCCSCCFWRGVLCVCRGRGEEGKSPRGEREIYIAKAAARERRRMANKMETCECWEEIRD